MGAVSQSGRPFLTDMSTNRIDRLRAPLFVSWQLTRDCDLCCLHCCTDSAPGKRMRGEPSTKVVLTIFRKAEGRTFPVNIVRE